MKEYYIADPHFGHAGIIASCRRPFRSTEEMDETLLRNWNERVRPEDRVYLLGDVFWKKDEAARLLPQLKGKIVFIPGNHDETWYRPTLHEDRFSAVYAMGLERKTAGRRETLCHYPLTEWRNSSVLGGKTLSYMIYGHVHNGTRYRDLLRSFLALNAGADVNGFCPVTFDEMVENNQEFRLNRLTDPEDRAFYLACRYHAHQVDKAGAPYIQHPAAVAAECPDEESRTVAWLHDTLEDTPLTADFLAKWFSPAVVEAVKLLTRPADEPYEEYVLRVKQNPLAKTVKLADLSHNMDLSRLKTITERDLARRQKYERAISVLKD